MREGLALRMRRRLSVEMAGSPKFPQKPLPSRTCSYDPGRIGRNSPWRSARRGHGDGNVRDFFDCSFEAQSHGLTTRCLRFAVPVARRDARLASGCAATLCRMGLAPTGSPNERFQLCVRITYHSPFASLLGAIPLKRSINSLCGALMPCAGAYLWAADLLVARPCEIRRARYAAC